MRTILGIALRLASPLLLLPMLAGCDVFTGTESLLSRAEQRLEAGNYGEALVDLRNVLDKKPDDVRALLALAQLSVQTGDHPTAERMLKQAEKSGADLAQVADIQARLMLERNQFQQLFTSIIAGTLPVPEPQLSLYRARALAGLGRTEEARVLFSTLVDKPSAASQAHVGLANVLFTTGQAEAAMREIDLAIAADAKSALALMVKGTLLQRSGRIAEAEQAWRRALELAPGRLTLQQHLGLLTTLAEIELARNNLVGAGEIHASMVRVSPQGLLTEMMGGRLLVARGEANAAVNNLQRLTAKYPEFPTVRITLASALLAQGSIEQAVTELNQLVTRLPNAAALNLALNALKTARSLPAEGRASAPRWIAIGTAQMALEQPMAARQALNRALQADPESFPAASGLVALDLRAGKLSEAAVAAKALMQKYPKEPAAATLAGDARAALQQYADADAAYRVAWSLRHDPSVAIALYRVREAGKLEQALAPLRDWLAEKPADVAVRHVYARALMESGDKPGAKAEYEHLLRDSPRDVAALNNLAILYAESGEPRALATAKKAYDVAPRVPAVADTYGWLLAQDGKISDALKLLEEAVKQSSGAEIHYHYAVVLSRAGNAAKAKEVLTRLLQDNPRFESRPAAEKLLASL